MRRVRHLRGLLAAVAGVTVLALAVAAVMVATAAAGSNAPSIEIQGNTYANTTGITGQVAQQIQFSMNARSGGKTPTSGWFEDQFYNVAQDGTLSQVSYNNVQVQCLSADTSTHTVWFSGLISAGDDLRQPASVQQQEQSIISAGKLILYGRLHDGNGDGSADQRSLFVTQATTAYPNAYLSSADNGTIANPWFISGNATSAASACLAHDSAFQAADYQVVDGPTNQVQWLDPNDSTTVGSPITGTATNMANPPAQSIYSLASINRTLLSPTLYMALR
jgi:hypothetical protein